MRIFRKCCFCCQLATGAIILGWYVMISSILIGIISILNLVNKQDVLKALVTEGYVEKDYSTTFKVMNGANVGINFIMGIAAILLIVGAMKRNVSLVLPFLVFYLVYILLGLLFNVVLATMSETGEIVSLFEDLIHFCWSMYWWLCVLSLHQELKEEETRPRETFLMSPNQAVAPMNKGSYPAQQNML